MEINEEIYAYVKQNLETTENVEDDKLTETTENFSEPELNLLLKICTDSASIEDRKEWEKLTGGDKEVDEQIKSSFNSAFKLASNFDNNLFIKNENVEKLKAELEEEKKINKKLTEEILALFSALKKLEKLKCFPEACSVIEPLTNEILHENITPFAIHKTSMPIKCNSCHKVCCQLCSGVECDSSKHDKEGNNWYCHDCYVICNGVALCDHCMKEAY